MKKTLCIILAVMLLAVSLCACGTDSKSIVGSWSGSSEGIAITMTFEKDGTGSMSALGGLAVENFTYKIEGASLTVTTTDDDTTVFDYSLDGDSLTLIGDGETVTFSRVKN